MRDVLPRIRTRVDRLIAGGECDGFHVLTHSSLVPRGAPVPDWPPADAAAAAPLGEGSSDLRELPRIRVLLPAGYFAVLEVPDMSHLGIKSLAVGLADGGVPALDQYGIPASHNSANCQVQILKVVLNSSEHTRHDGFSSHKRRTSPIRSVLRFVPFDSIRERLQKRLWISALDAVDDRPYHVNEVGHDLS